MNATIISKNGLIRKFMMRFVVTFISMVCFSQVVWADDPQGIVNSINRVTGGYDLIATISDNTVTVTGTLRILFLWPIWMRAMILLKLS